MDRLRIGRSIRAIRIRLGWRQADLAERAEVSRAFVSKVERGEIRRSSLESLERVCGALGADLDVRVRWRGEGLDRLLDASHASLVAQMAAALKPAGWRVAIEATFNHFGERGSVDLLGWHEVTRSLLVVEVKSVVADAQGTLLPLDRKARLGHVIAAARGWSPDSVSRLLVLPAHTTTRRRIGHLAAIFDGALPARGVEVRRWLRAPIRPIAGILYLSDALDGSGGRSRAGLQRVNPPRRHQNQAR